MSYPDKQRAFSVLQTQDIIETAEDKKQKNSGVPQSVFYKDNLD
jgi:hypothetical protein